MFALPVAPQDLAAFRAALETFHPAGFRAMALASAQDLRAVLHGVNVPTLLIYGDNDQRAPMTVAEHLGSEISTSQLVVLRGAGHVCNVELPDQYNDAVRDFLIDHRP
jgi:pimeloyl-ACP methyl ester carboxylesterase